MPTVECLRLVGEARQAQLAGDNAVAISLAERAVQSSTTDSASYYSAFLVMADGHASEGDPGKAAEVCEMAMSICGPDTVGFAHNPVPWARCIVGAYEYTLQARAAGGGERARLPAWMSSAKKLQALSELAANAIPRDAGALSMRATAHCVPSASGADLRKAAANWRTAASLRHEADPADSRIPGYLHEARVAERLMNGGTQLGRPDTPTAGLSGRTKPSPMTGHRTRAPSGTKAGGKLGFGTATSRGLTTPTRSPRRSQGAAGCGSSRDGELGGSRDGELGGSRGSMPPASSIASSGRSSVGSSCLS